MDKQLLSKEAISILETRIINEEFSGRLYEDMSLWFEDKGYVNLAKLYKDYSKEEYKHASWSKKFLLSYNLKPTLKVMQSPEAEYSTCLDILEATRDHEIQITQECSTMAKDALRLGEIPLYTLALKYCEEQINELDKAYNLLSSYALADSSLDFDQYVGKNLSK